jgi:hypothetical protein
LENCELDKIIFYTVEVWLVFAGRVKENLFVTNSAGNSISKMTPSGQVSTFAAGVASPSDITIDAMDNLYTTDASNTITRITPAGTVSVIKTGLSEPDPIAVDHSSNFFVGRLSIGAICKVSRQ